MSANPLLDLKLDEEYQAIEYAIAESPYRDKIELKAKLACTITDFIQVLSTEEPDILHFSEDTLIERWIRKGWIKEDVIQVKHLQDFFALANEKPKLLFINRWFSSSQTLIEINKNIDCVIHTYGDKYCEDTTTFIKLFYKYFFSNQELKESVQRANNMTALYGWIVRDEAMEVEDFCISDIVSFDSIRHSVKKAPSINEDIIGVGSSSSGTIIQTHSCSVDKIINAHNNIENIDNKGVINVGINQAIDYEKKLKEIIDNLSSGNMVFNTPKTIAYKESEIVTLRISKTDIFTDDLPKENQQIENCIKVYSFMSAKLQSEDFKIMALNEEEQALGEIEHTEWKWNITSLKKQNKGILYLRITIRMPLDAQKEERKDLPVWERSVEVLSHGKIVFFFIRTFGSVKIKLSNVKNKKTKGKK